MDPAPIEVEVDADRPDPDDPSRVPATVTVIRVDDSLAPHADLGDALSAVPGAVIRRLGGLGSWTSVALRGSTARQVEVQLDGIPLNPDGAGAVDLSEIPLWAFARVDVWRSNPPPWLGPGGIGGVVDLVTAPEQREETSIAVGSYGTSTARAAVARRGPRTNGLVLADAFATAGDFPYFFDGGTPFTVIDDRLSVRDNADVRQLAVHGFVEGGGSTRWTLIDSLVARDQGVPGFTYALSPDARYDAARDLLGGRVTWSEGATRSSVTAWTLGRSERFADPSGTVGPGGGTARGDSGTAGARGTVAWAPRDWLRCTSAIDGHGDVWSDGVDPRLRGVARAGAEAAVGAGPWIAAPSAWLSVIDDRDVAADQVSRVDVLPRIGVLWRPTEPISVHATGGRAIRAPDLDELFGDRGAFVGNPSLRPEDAWTADLGARVDTSPLSAEITGYWSEIRGEIVYVQNAQQVARPINLDRATIRGLEAGGQLDHRGLVAGFSGSVTDGIDRSTDPTYAGNAIPRLPTWEIAADASARRGPVQLGYDGSFTAGNWLDEANFALAPPRWLHGAFARVGSREWSATAEIRNLTNQIVAVGPRDPLVDDGERAVRAVTDFTGYPLPGRTFLVGLSWSGR